jgi:hypothetical protein
MLQREHEVVGFVSGEVAVEIFLQADDLAGEKHLGPFGQGHKSWDVVRVGSSELRGGRPRGDGTHLLFYCSHKGSLLRFMGNPSRQDATRPTAEPDLLVRQSETTPAVPASPARQIHTVSAVSASPTRQDNTAPAQQTHATLGAKQSGCGQRKNGGQR